MDHIYKYMLIVIVSAGFSIKSFCQTLDSLGAPARIYGKITGEKSKPLNGANVVIENSIDGATTDSTGYYEMECYMLKAIVEYEDETHLSNFMKLFNEFIDTFNRDQQRNFYNGLESILIITRDAATSNEYSAQCFKIHKEMLAKKLYSSDEGGHFTLMMFLNIVKNAVSLREFTWLDKFIRDYISKLRPDQQIDMQYYCTAYIEFGKGNCEKALTHIVKVNYEYFHHKIDVKMLMLKIYYELNCFEQLYSLIDTSKHFLSKTKLLTEVLSERVSNFIKFLGSLVKIKTGNDFFGIEALKKEILNTKNANNRDWLLEKLDELEHAAVKLESAGVDY